MTNRQIKVRGGSSYSKKLHLFSGIPQGFPLSVVLFLIANNKLCTVINMHKDLKFCAYADDFFIFKTLDKTKNLNIDISGLISNIQSSCDSSEAELALSKSKHLHISRKL